MSDEEKCWSCKSFEPATGMKHMVGVGWQCRDSAACRMRRDARSAPMPSPAIVLDEARRVIEAWNDPEVWESDHLYDCIRDLEKAMRAAGQFTRAAEPDPQACRTRACVSRPRWSHARKAAPMVDANWWGRDPDGAAHYFAVLSTMKSACGRTFTHRGQDFTRLTQDTGVRWPKCARCVAALAKRSTPTKGPAK